MEYKKDIKNRVKNTENLRQKTATGFLCYIKLTEKETAESHLVIVVINTKFILNVAQKHVSCAELEKKLNAFRKDTCKSSE